MTVASALNRKTFEGDDATTSFATTPIKFFETSDLKVYVTNNTTGVATLLTEDTHYTVSGGDASVGATGTVDTSGGSVPHGALLSGTTLVVVRELPILQGADFINNDASDANTAEAALDKLVMNVQRMDDRLDRSLVVSDGDISGADFTVPTPTASSLLGWASDALSIVNYELTDLTVSAVPAYALDIITAADDDAFFATMADGMTAESSVDVADVVPFVDVSLSPDDGRKATVQQLWNSLNVLTAETAPATGDKVPLYDADGLATDAITLENLLKVVNGLTEDTTPDVDADFVLTYDTSASGVKKAKPENFATLKQGTLTATTSGTESAFTGLPAGIKRIHVGLVGVSTNGTTGVLLQVGEASGGYKVTGYNAGSINAPNGASPTVAATTTGFSVSPGGSASVVSHGLITLTLIDEATNLWAVSGSVFNSGTTSHNAPSGTVALAGVLDRIRLYGGGTDTFDAGSWNITYER